jgi:ABC-type bacteriocin/lantibiotic exporter with double-glycine peptidase domain
MMAMKYFQPSLRLTREMEFDIWREANLVESYGTSKEGLALAAAKRGFVVYTMGKHLHHSFVDAIADKIPNVDYRMLQLLYKDTQKKFHAMHVTSIKENISLSGLEKAVTRLEIPIILTTTALFGEDEDLPHWIVLAGYSRDNLYVNNPLAKTSNTRIKRTEFKNNLGYRGIECVVVVRGIRSKSNSV